MAVLVLLGINGDVALTEPERGVAGLMACATAVRVKYCKEIASMLAALRWMTSVMASSFCK